MLKFFNRLEKTRNFVLLVFGILMVLSLVLFYAPAGRNNVSENLASSQEVAATVSGQKITAGELYRQKQDFSERFGGQQGFPAKLIINQLIGSRIARVEAARLGLTPSDAEVASEIREQWASTGTPFDQKTYEDNVTQKYGSVSAYEESVRDDLSARKLEAFLTSGVTVSEDEVLNDFKKKNTKFDLSYVVVDPTELAKTITPSDAELKDYFDKNKASYYISVPQKKIKYVFINTAKIGEKLPISDADLKAEYDKLPPDKKIAGVLGQEIVVRIAKTSDPQSEQQATSKAADIEARLKKNGNTVSEEDFANVAKGYSENPGTAPLGGKLSGPVRENPNKPDDPYQQLLKLKPGDVTDPITYQGRIFILRRGDDVPKSFDDAKKELDVSLRNRRAYA
ncbi:MAG TPA: SurA N-terminal domain-containing protein, partial [Pyrinomonadaceae bacterium]